MLSNIEMVVTVGVLVPNMIRLSMYVKLLQIGREEHVLCIHHG